MNDQRRLYNSYLQSIRDYSLQVNFQCRPFFVISEKRVLIFIYEFFMVVIYMHRNHFHLGDTSTLFHITLMGFQIIIPIFLDTFHMIYLFFPV